jgi:hypothetical protein
MHPVRYRFSPKLTMSQEILARFGVAPALHGVMIVRTVEAAALIEAIGER